MKKYSVAVSSRLYSVCFQEWRIAYERRIIDEIAQVHFPNYSKRVLRWFYLTKIKSLKMRTLMRNLFPIFKICLFEMTARPLRLNTSTELDCSIFQIRDVDHVSFYFESNLNGLSPMCECSVSYTSNRQHQNVIYFWNKMQEWFSRLTFVALFGNAYAF